MKLNAFKRTAAAASIALAAAFAAPAQAAFIVNENTVEGNWFSDPSNISIEFDFIPTPTLGGTSGVLFVVLYTFDGAGNPLWLSTNIPVTEGQFSFQNQDLFRFTGGTWNARTANTTVTPRFGQISISFDTCSEATVTVTPAAGSNLNALNNLRVIKSETGIANFRSQGCVYTQPFTACPAGTTPFQGQPRTCLLTGTQTQPIRLTNSATYLLQGKVQIGGPLARNADTGASVVSNPTTITIEPGTLIRGATGGLDYLQINAGSRIFAEGTPDAPIIFTGPTEDSGTWGGLVIAGLAQNNAANPAGGPAAFEADPTTLWGGNNDADSSGVLRYIQIRNAGRVISGNVELNSLTLGSVGSGTVLEYVQAHNGLDDCFEFFGGTVNAKYLVCSRGNDDGLDVDVGGYRGRIQYALVTAGGNADTGDGSCVESDNNASSLNALPRANPIVSNMTCVGRAAPNWRRQIRIRRGSAGQYWNSVVANQPNGECLTVFDTATFDQITAGALQIRGTSLLGCATNFGAADAALTTTVQNWFNTAGWNNSTGTLAGNLSGIFPVVGGGLDGTAAALPANDPFFDKVNFRGAFGPAPARDWTIGWTFPGSIGNFN
jgi:hypothetical protein